MQTWRVEMGEGEGQDTLEIIGKKSKTRLK